MTKLPLKLSEPDNLVIASPLQEAKAYLAGANSLSYSSNCSLERVANSEFTQDLAQVTLSPSLSPSIYLNDEEMVDLEELFAKDQPDGDVTAMWKDIDDVYLSNIPRERLGTELIRDSSVDPAACNVNDPSWGAIITYPAPKCHAFTMPILKNSIFINEVEKRPEFVEHPTTKPIDMNLAPLDENEPNSSIVKAVRMASL
ncbi:hypothetical protein COLO4_16040 [Corchorus olitorius]|uniref:Uncharacterized protein n=1 Tax=Corchorus olitorius TaxID=93759 RepID=A0A1R3JK32_9ROSI|nr:hypothetical protein COLO4_16040 [Corchorus olitorius]